MRILFVHDRFGASAGAEANIRDTAAGLCSRGHRLGILHGPGTGRGEEEWRSIFPDRFSLAGDSASRATHDALALFQPDAIYVHNLTDPSVLAALIRPDVPRVRMVHDHQPFCLRGCRYTPWTRRPCSRALSLFCVFPCGGCMTRDRTSRWRVRWNSYVERKSTLALTRNFDRLIVASDYMHTELRRNGVPPARIEIHPPVPRPAPLPPRPESSPTGDRLIYSGQLARGKGVDVLLESLARVTAPFTCTIAGEGHHRTHCEALSRQLGLGRQVTFTGYIPSPELPALYRASDIAMVSSVWPEPFGLAGLEAMRSGLPVVAFDVGGISEWMFDGLNGFLVPWMDRAAFAARVELLLRDPGLARQLGAHGHRLAGLFFDFDDYVSSLEDLFTRVATERQCEAAA